MKQIVAHKKLSPIHGALLVLGLVAVLILLNYLVIDVLAVTIGYTAACVAFWVIGGLIALQLLRIYVVKFSYELSADVLRLNRSYGKRVRHIEDIYLSQLAFVGAPEEAKRRWPDAKRVRAVHARGEFPITAVVYKTASGTYVALIQANDELKSQLTSRIRRAGPAPTNCRV